MTDYRTLIRGQLTPLHRVRNGDVVQLPLVTPVYCHGTVTLGNLCRALMSLPGRPDPVLTRPLPYNLPCRVWRAPSHSDRSADR